MKRIISAIVTLCLLLSCTAVAFAKAGPTIVKQPETQTTDAKGKVTFECKVKNATSITWYFVDPATGEKTSARNIGKLFKGIVVRGPNGQKLSLSKVPDGLHGWSLYCHIFGNGYTLDSDTVQLLIYGKDTAEQSEQPAEQQEQPAEQSEQPAEQQEQPAEQQEQPAEQQEQPAEQQEQPAEQQEQPAVEAIATPEPPDLTDVGPKYEVNDLGEPIIPDKEITIKVKHALLYPVDSRGNLKEDAEGVSTMTFLNTAEFFLKADAPLRYVTFNGIRFEPAEPMTSIKLSGVSDDLYISAKLAQIQSEGAVNFDNMCTVACEGCTFTYRAAKLTNVTEGQVPAGATITVLCTDRDRSANGYIVNGAEAVGQGKASYKITITENTTISVP